MNVKACPIMEAIAKKLSGIESITDKSIKSRMISAAVKAGKDAAEHVYGGFDMMKLYRENEQLKGQNANLSRHFNDFAKTSMSIDKVQEMTFAIMAMCSGNGYLLNDDLTQEYVNKFIEEWRENNDC